MQGLLTCGRVGGGRGGVRVERDAADAVAPPRSIRACRGRDALCQRPRVVFLGDSLTMGYGLPKEQADPVAFSSRNVWTREGSTTRPSTMECLATPLRRRRQPARLGADG